MDELVNSLKKLFSNPEFSDLSIVSTHKTYPVHKAVVCLRSPYLAERCRDPALTGFPTVVEVKDDDPQAVHLAMEYFYHLDYSDTLPGELQTVQPNKPPHENSGPEQNNSLVPESPVVVTNGFDHSEDHPQPPPIPNTSTTQAEPTEGLPSEPLDDFLPPSATKKKKPKKKGRKASIELPPSPPADPQPDAPTEEEAPSQQPAPEASPPATAPEPAENRPLPQPAHTQEKLTTHAKLYSLSAKYGIPELRALALAKFRKRAETGWDADDFIRAAGEVYASPLLGEENHREMRRAVTGLLYGHRELLDMGETEGILRGELGLDLIRWLREEGVW
ncbi:hypothetical protein B0T25DRAFT_632128 [Lasiosphaeria hispida]|uniref:BTB domain-containing protein n=1 Tax=Lasiosphaeria hispida TaxID=260671 RepID=A0AAJ0MEQ7_9PEZI|nr:hypothetical protein B0T25DRAFT_632128 [Lasiosphaeria hispida]